MFTDLETQSRELQQITDAGVLVFCLLLKSVSPLLLLSFASFVEGIFTIF